MGTLQILGIKLPQVPYCHTWQVEFLMLMWDLALGQSKITGIFFRQGHRVGDIIYCNIAVDWSRHNMGAATQANLGIF